MVLAAPESPVDPRWQLLLRGAEADEELEALGDVRQAEPSAEPDGLGIPECGVGYSERTRQALQRLPAGQLPGELVAMLLTKLDEDAALEETDGRLPGSVLIFLPGVPEIKRLSADLARAPAAHRWLLLHLHGDLPAQEQRKVFGRPPLGQRKIILSTNVAETSLTIDDVTIVIDTGRVKESSYDALNASAQLLETWAARSSRRQRRGRAGRTRRGKYYSLYSRAQERRLPEQAPPEILRVPLENLYLTVKSLGLGGGDARAFLGRALQPPSEVALDAASMALRRVGALKGGRLTPLQPAKLSAKDEAKLDLWVAAKQSRDFAGADKIRNELKKLGIDVNSARAQKESMLGASAAADSIDSGGDEELTALGLHLARMPLDPRVGKILVYGALLGCIDPALTIAAAMSLSRSPFVTPMDKRAEANEARAIFSREKSDQMALLRAYEAWEHCRTFDGTGAARRFAEVHFLSANGMEELHSLRKSLAGTLSDIGFAKSSAEAQNDAVSDGGTAADAASLHKANLVRALMCAGLYPNLVRVRMPDTKFEKTVGGAIETVVDDARAVKFYAAPHGRVFIHPSSVLFDEAKFEGGWLVFTTKQQVQTDRVYVRDVTAVSQLALLIFGGEVVVHHETNTVTIDSEITFEAPGRVAVLVRELRGWLDKLLLEKIAKPTLQIGAHPVVSAIVHLITTEKAGLS